MDEVPKDWRIISLFDESGSIHPSIRDRIRDFGERRQSPRQRHLVEKMMEGFKGVREVKEFNVKVSYYLNIPTQPTEKTVTVDAHNVYEAEEKVRKMYPNINSISATECPQKES